MKTISVIIPSYNHDKYICMAVESVLSQTYTNLELIVVDDGSTDGSRDYLRTIRDSRVLLVEQENAGAHNAINRGLSLAQGEFLAILNSDDIFNLDRIKIGLERLNSGADLVTSWIQVIDSKNKILGVKKGWQNMLPWPITKPVGKLASIDVFAINLLQSNFVSTTSNIIFSRKLYDAIGEMTNLRFCHDWDYLLRSVKDFHCEIIDQPLLKYRIHSKNTISSDRAWMLFEICWIYAVHFTCVMEKTLLSIGDDNLAKDLISFMGESINLQGNDKVIWMILLFIEQQRGLGISSPEYLILNNDELRKKFISYVV